MSDPRRVQRTGNEIAAASGALRVSVTRASPPLAILYAIGAYWIVYSLAVGLLVIASFIVLLPVSGLYLPAAALAGSAAAAAVALRSGGWISVVGLAVAAVAYVLVLECRGDPTMFGTCASDIAGIVQGHVAEVVGAVIGVPLAFGLRLRDGRSAVLLAAGIIGIGLPIVHVGFGFLEPVTGSPAYERFLWATGLRAAAAVAAGAVLGWMAKRRSWALLTVGAPLLLPWLGGTFRQWLQGQLELREHGFTISVLDIVQREWVFFLPLIFCALVIIGFAAALAVRVAARRRGA